MEIDKMEKWLDTACATGIALNMQTPRDIVYYKGHLVEDNTKENPEVQKLAKLFLSAAERNIVDLFQKKIKAGGAGGQPIYEYMARIKK
jgi:hypothetical protein